MTCRGPDGEGTWEGADGQVALMHRRLAIIDLSPRAAQPMASADGRHVIVFNGEIYNFRALRTALEATGHRFRSDSDTEVLLHLYAERGAAMVSELRGMFAFAIWDAEARGVFMARDTFGIKPLYYADDGRTLRFASEVKGLLRGGGIDTSPEPAGHAGFFLWGHVPDPFTMYRGIRALPAGSTMWCGPDAAPRVAEFSSPSRILAEAEANPSITNERSPADRLHDALRDSVTHHLVADVDVGVFLSAGIDSTVLAALVAETGVRPRTITLGFREFEGTENDETQLAEEVAALYGCDHSTVWITRDDFEDELPRFLDRMDQPTIDGVNTYFVAKAAAERGIKVALSGLGGDELFGGYPSFRQLPKLVGMLGRVPAARRLGRVLRTVSAPILSKVASPKAAGLLEYGHDMAGAYLLRRGLFAPWELTDVLDPELARAGWKALDTLHQLKETIAALSTDRFRVSALESSWYMRSQLLRDSDWTGMSHGLEIRVPFVDVALWRESAPLVARQPNSGKETVASAPRPPLPAGITGRAKTGFATPVRHWVADGGGLHRDRGLRGWARRVYAEHCALT
jgi:asparagine synthase (glutamine-hydrolysing)